MEVKSLGLIFFFYVFEWTQHCEARLNCSMKTGLRASNFIEDDDVFESLVYKFGQTSRDLQALDCFCQLDEQTRPFISDSSVQDIFPNGWENSTILYVHDCDQLEASLSNNVNDIADKLSYGVLIFENIAEFYLSNFDAARRGLGDQSQNGTFSVIHFKNVTFFSVPNPLQIQDKIEVLFEDVKTQVKIDLAVINIERNISPKVRIINCDFGLPSAARLTNIVSGDQMFIITFENDQKATETGCEYDYKGELEIINSNFGAALQDTIKVRGAKEVTVKDNVIEYSAREAFYMENVKELSVVGNTVRYDESRPLLLTKFFKKSASCSNEDLPEDAVREIEFSFNKFWRLHDDSASNLEVFSADFPDYSTSFENKFDLMGNTENAFCDCAQTYEDDTNSDSIERLNNKLMKNSRCRSTKSGGIGFRKDICKGIHPAKIRNVLDTLRMEIYNGSPINGPSMLVTFFCALVADLATPIWMLISRLQVGVFYKQRGQMKLARPLRPSLTS